MAGFLALILHAHLPFVRHSEAEDVLEEDWLFEAITESYIPLLAVMQRLRREEVPFQLTMSISPTLCTMLNDELLRQRFLHHLARTINLAEREIDRHADDAPRRALAEFYTQHFHECRRLYVDQWHCDLLGTFRWLQEEGAIEIIASAATHGLLPLLNDSPRAVRAQIAIGCDVYRQVFGREPKGFWLPECAFAPGLELMLQEANLRWFTLDSHGLLFGKPRPRHAIYGPCYTPAGPAAFARDRDSSRQVWSAREGYPGDAVYREFYRDVGFEQPPSYLWPGASDRAPRFTGIKYHRVTGREEDKEIYEVERGKAKAEEHARHFLEARQRQLSEQAEKREAPIVVIPFDAELFGHWWFEGPHFLETFVREAAREPQQLQLTTPGRYLAEHPTQQIVTPAASSWGEHGHLAVWIDHSNSWIYPHLHACARRMVEVAQAHADNVTPLAERALKQLVRELLLMQSSDWAFLMKTGTARPYAIRRTTEHVIRFNTLYDQLLDHHLDEEFLRECEERDNLFPNVNWRYYA